MTMTPAISWIRAQPAIMTSPLRICPPDTVYSTSNCCVRSTFRIEISKDMSYDDTKGK
jgi:hypothetical protein